MTTRLVKQFCAVLAVLPLTALYSFAQRVPTAEGPVKAPPPAEPPQVRSTPLAADGPQAGPLPGPPVLWSIGQPTDEEQLYLEYINRSRANPPAEGFRLASTTDPDVLGAYSYFAVDLTLMQNQFNAIAAVPPLAMNAQLMSAARWHSGDMYTNSYQGHDQTNNSTVLKFWDRLTAQGYPWSSCAENVFSYADSVWHGHAGFNVDWGSGTGGMQTPPGHRNNIHSTSYREVGIGVVIGSNGSVGPQLVTQDFGVRSGATPMISGVVYYDLNGNNFYDIGEGIGGVTVNVPGSSYYAVTADSGGYAVPVTTNGSYAVAFSASNLATQKTAVVSSQANVKSDFIPAYAPPVISGPNPALLNRTNIYNFTPVGAATGYQWNRTTLTNHIAVEGAETLGNVTISSSPGYTVQDSTIKFAGAYSFHFAHPSPADQFLTLNPTLRPAVGSQLTFYKRLGWAASGQVARAQISTNSGATWQDLWSQAGTSSSGEANFTQVSTSLAAYANQNVKLRFVYDYAGGSYYYQTSSGDGLYIDNIAVSSAQQLVNEVTNTVPSGTSFAFNPTSEGNYLLRVRAQINSRTLPWGPTLSVAAVTAPPVISLVGKPVFSGNQAQIDFSVADYRSGMTFQLWTAPSPAGSWSLDGAAGLQTLLANSKFRFSTATNSNARFYRIRGTY